MKKHVCVQTELTPKKEWGSPQLKKIDIEAITAMNSNVFGDGGGLGS
jgi:hypothetical protein